MFPSTVEPTNQAEQVRRRDSSFRLGIDVGGTHTDAVILDTTDRVIASTKAPTTSDITTGIVQALQDVLTVSQLPPDTIAYAMLGTTHCTNAVVTRRELNSVGVIRLGAPATRAVEPLLTWPLDLKQVVGVRHAILHGGHEYNGEPLSELDEKEVQRTARAFKGHVLAVAVTGVFSSVNAAHELRVREIVRDELGADIPVSLSSEIGSVSLLERENATVLNAALMRVAQRAMKGFERAVHRLDIPATLFLGQNDGSLMSLDYAVQYPIFTIASGPANSIRGAAALSQLRDAIVVDIGGTTTDIGVLYKGFPRESQLAVEIGGVATNFRMPDLISIGLGGGSRVHPEAAICVGPDSVGYQLQAEARVFGGSQLTATDLAVAAGRIQLGNPGRVQALPKTTLDQGLDYIRHTLEDYIDRVKLSAGPVPVVAVGGGNILFPDTLRGVSEIIRPEQAGVANAIGVAIAQVSGTVDSVFSLEKLSRTEALDQATALAYERAIAAGAAPDGVEVLDLEEVPLAYLPGNAVRIKVKAVGSLRMVPD